MNHTMEEVAGWLREAARLEEEFLSGTSIGALPVACAVSIWEDRAAQVEAMAYDHKITEMHVTELAKAIRYAAVLAGICKDSGALTGPDLIMLCADMGDAIKSAHGEAMAIIKTCDTCTWFVKDYWHLDYGRKINICGNEKCPIIANQDCKFGCIHHEDKQ